MVTLENPPPTLETCGELNGDDYTKNYSKIFRKMVEKCLQKDPEKRYMLILCTSLLDSDSDLCCYYCIDL